MKEEAARKAGFPPGEYRPAAKGEFDPQQLHGRLLREAPRRLAYRSGLSVAEVAEARSKLYEALLAALGNQPPVAPLAADWFEPERRPLPAGSEIGSPDVAVPRSDTITVQRVEFTTEPGVRAIGWLVIPENKTTGTDRATLPVHGRPTFLCVQGHTSGAHISLGERRYTGDGEAIAGGKDYALQAARRGYNAFLLEQRNFGERMDSRPASNRPHYDYGHPFTDERCRHQSMVALLIGRTLQGERVHDIRRAVALLEHLPTVDPRRIYLIGNSGGGTAAFYATCTEPRVAGLIASCSFATYAETIGSIDHCSDNYLPGALENFDMPDLAMLIAPRPMVIVAGRTDPIYPLPAIQAAQNQAARIYSDMGAKNRVGLHIGEGGHNYYPEAWDLFEQVSSLKEI